MLGNKKGKKGKKVTAPRSSYGYAEKSKTMHPEGAHKRSKPKHKS